LLSAPIVYEDVRDPTGIELNPTYSEKKTIVDSISIIHDLEES
jgi:hypothetical protein